MSSISVMSSNFGIKLSQQRALTEGSLKQSGRCLRHVENCFYILDVTVFVRSVFHMLDATFVFRTLFLIVGAKLVLNKCSFMDAMSMVLKTV